MKAHSFVNDKKIKAIRNSINKRKSYKPKLWSKYEADQLQHSLGQLMEYNHFKAIEHREGQVLVKQVVQ